MHGRHDYLIRKQVMLIPPGCSKTACDSIGDALTTWNVVGFDRNSRPVLTRHLDWKAEAGFSAVSPSGTVVKVQDFAK